MNVNKKKLEQLLQNTEQCTTGSLREKVVNFMESNPVLNKLPGIEWYEIEDALVDFIISLLNS